MFCTRNVHFTFNGKIYRKIDGVAMASPWRPVLADTFTITSEMVVLTEITEYSKHRKRYVDDTNSFVKLGTINYIITKLNRFNNNIQFTFEEEGKETLLF